MHPEIIEKCRELLCLMQSAEGKRHEVGAMATYSVVYQLLEVIIKTGEAK